VRITNPESVVKSNGWTSLVAVAEPNALNIQLIFSYSSIRKFPFRVYRYQPRICQRCVLLKACGMSSSKNIQHQPNILLKTISLKKPQLIKHNSLRLCLALVHINCLVEKTTTRKMHVNGSGRQRITTSIYMQATTSQYVQTRG
jgi:hypothetical protein